MRNGGKKAVTVIKQQKKNQGEEQRNRTNKEKQTMAVDPVERGGIPPSLTGDYRNPLITEGWGR